MKFEKPTSSQEEKKSLEKTMSELPQAVRIMLPESNLSYYKSTNEMHCDLDKPGGSKFTENSNILEVLQKDATRIVDSVDKRLDDRGQLLADGASESAFLPATKTDAHPEGLPEALYYKVEGVKGKLGIIQIKDLDMDAKVLVRREKSVIEDGVEKVPNSFSVVKGSIDEMPDTDFATVIIGRDGGENGKNEVWTIHPGMPIRASQGDFFPGSETLPGPKEGEKQEVIVTTIKDILETGKMTAEDYLKIIVGNEDDVLSQYEIRK